MIRFSSCNTSEEKKVQSAESTHEAWRLQVQGEKVSERECALIFFSRRQRLMDLLCFLRLAGVCLVLTMTTTRWMKIQTKKNKRNREITAKVRKYFAWMFYNPFAQYRQGQRSKPGWIIYTLAETQIILSFITLLLWIELKCLVDSATQNVSKIWQAHRKLIS